MSKRKAKRLYWKALDRYREGFIAGGSSRIGRAWHDDDPAYAAGWDARCADQRIDQQRLPLEVWALVVARELRP